MLSLVRQQQDNERKTTHQIKILPDYFGDAKKRSMATFMMEISQLSFQLSFFA